MVHGNFDFLYWIYKSQGNHTWFFEILTFFYFEAFPNSTNLQEITHIWCYTQTLSKFYRPQHLVHGNFDFLSWIYKSTRNHPWFIEILTFLLFYFSTFLPFYFLLFYKSTTNHTWFIEILTFNFEAFPNSTNLQEITHIGTGTQTVSLFYWLQHMVHWNFDFLYSSLS